MFSGLSGLFAGGGIVLHLLTQKNFWLRSGILAAAVALIIIGLLLLVRKPLGEAAGTAAKVVI